MKRWIPWDDKTGDMANQKNESSLFLWAHAKIVLLGQRSPNLLFFRGCCWVYV